MASKGKTLSKTFLDPMVKCRYCQEFNKTVEPIIITKFGKNRYQFVGVCCICNKLKKKTLKRTQVETLPEDIKSSSKGTVYNNTLNDVKTGGIYYL